MIQTTLEALKKYKKEAYLNTLSRFQKKLTDFLKK